MLLLISLAKLLEVSYLELSVPCKGQKKDSVMVEAVDSSKMARISMRNIRGVL